MLAIAALVLGMLAVAAFATRLAALSVPMTWIAPAAALVVMSSSLVAQYLLDITRLQMQPWKFFGVSLVARVATAFAGVAAVVWLSLGLDGLLAVQALVSVLALPVAALAVRRDLTLAVDRNVVTKLLHFGYPFIFSSIAFWLFGSVDRWMLAAMSSVEEVGIYSIAQRFASIVMMVSLAFGQAWAPLALKFRADEPQKYRGWYADVLVMLACGMLVVGGAVALFSDELIGFLMPAEYAPAARPLAVLCLGVVIQSTTQITGIGISLERKTSIFAHLSWLMAVINIALNLLLIPQLGATGAAWATALSYLFLTASYMYYSQALHPLPIRWRRIVIWFAMLALIGIVAGQPVLAFEGLPALWLKLLLLAACLGVGFMLTVWRRPVHVH
jgi:O-antigen/teichoic acid export membrane protein